MDREEALTPVLPKWIEAEAAALGERQLRPAAERLLRTYREERSGSASAVRSAADALAYGVLRTPATTAVLRRIFEEIPGDFPETLLDLGSGLGSSLWAAPRAFRRATLYDANPHLTRLAARLTEGDAAVRLHACDFRDTELAPHELVVISYVLNELSPAHAAAVVERAWAVATRQLVIVEPGSRDGFASVLQARQQLLAKPDAHLAAPCPQAAACPLNGHSTDWCHFAQRLNRSWLHRRLKGGELSYEDEKYVYVRFSRDATGTRAPARILNHPKHHPGFIQLTVCSAGGAVERFNVTKKDKEAFRAARKSRWGDVWTAGA